MIYNKKAVVSKLVSSKRAYRFALRGSENFNNLDEKDKNFVRFGNKRGKRGILTVHTIEGDFIKLEDTHAEVVRGRKIEIGRGCKIGKVIYQVSLDIYEDGIVDQVEEF